MFKKTFSSAQLEARTEVYIKYHEELKNVGKLHSAALHQVRNQVEPLVFLGAKSAKAEGKVSLEKIRVKAAMNEKKTQAFGPHSFNQAAWNAEYVVDDEMGDAEKALKKAVSTAEKKFLGDLLVDPEEKINEYKDCYKKSVEEAWFTFKENVTKRMDIQYAATSFEAEIDRARKDFETGVKSTVEDFEKKTKTLRDNFLKGIYDSALVEFDTAVNLAVEEFQWWASSALKYFCFKVNRMMEERKAKNKESREQQQKQQSQPQTSVSPKGDYELESYTVEKLVDMLKKKMVEEELQSAQRLANSLVEGRNAEEDAQRRDSLEKKVLEILNTLKRMNK